MGPLVTLVAISKNRPNHIAAQPLGMDIIQRAIELGKTMSDEDIQAEYERIHRERFSTTSSEFSDPSPAEGQPDIASEQEYIAYLQRKYS